MKICLVKNNHIHINILNNRSCKLYINTLSKHSKLLKDDKDVPICEDVGFAFPIIILKNL